MTSMRQKIGIIGAGAVGSASLLSSVLRGVAREIVVVNREPKRGRGVVADVRTGVERILEPSMSADERRALLLSAETLRKALASLPQYTNA